MLDTCLVSSMIMVFNIIFGFFATIGAVVFVGLTQALIQCCCYDNQGFRSLQQSAFSAFGPLLSIVHEIKRGRKNILLICNRIFLYFVMGLILFGSTWILFHENQSEWLDHISKTSNTDCNNICESDFRDLSSCEYFHISKEDLLNWTFCNWGIFAFSMINAIVLFMFRKNLEWSPVSQEFELRPI